MKPTVQQLPLQANYSFVSGAFNGLQFEAAWHQHIAYELTLFMKGDGRAYINNTEVNYQSGDIFLLGTNLPHQFFPKDTSMNALTIHFTEDCLGNHFFDLPECRPIKQILELSGYGLRITGNCRIGLSPLIQSLNTAVNANRIIGLLQCLQLISISKDYITINTFNKSEIHHTDNDFLTKIFKYTNDTFHRSVSLPKAAAAACMSVPTFCSYFKRHTHKTYFTYLNEIRIQYACGQLLQTNKSVTEICYESGFNTVTHFHRQFLRLKKTTPLQFRKQRITLAQ